MKTVMESSEHPRLPRRCVITLGSVNPREYVGLGKSNKDAFRGAMRVIENSMLPRMVRGRA